MKSVERVELLQRARHDLFREADRLAERYVNTSLNSKMEVFQRVAIVHEKISWIEAEIVKEEEDAE